jgi:hypothetical protein
MTYALIQNGLVHELWAENPNLDGLDIVEVTNSSVAVGWEYADGAFSPSSFVPDYVQEAHARLYDNDVIIIRCLKAGVAYPDEWKAFDIACRAVVDGTAQGPLPAVPTKPTGI